MTASSIHTLVRQKLELEMLCYSLMVNQKGALSYNLNSVVHILGLYSYFYEDDH